MDHIMHKWSEKIFKPISSICGASLLGKPYCPDENERGNENHEGIGRSYSSRSSLSVPVPEHKSIYLK
jgi:hypothetical protein